MDWKKVLKNLGLSEQLFFARPSKIKLYSGFGLGVAASLLLLTVIFLNYPYEQPFLNRKFQGSNGIGGKSYSVSSPFSFPRTDVSSSPELQRNNAEERVQDKIHEENISDRSNSGSIFDSNGGGSITLEKTHQVNISEKAKNATILDSYGEELITEKTHEGNFSQDKNRNIFSEVGRVGAKTHQGDFLGEVINANFSGKEEAYPAKTAEADSVERDKNESFLGKTIGFTDKGSDGNNMKDASDNGESVRTSATEESVSEKTHEENLFGKDKPASSSASGLAKSLGDYSAKCDIFDGHWVRDETKPLYPSGSCPYVCKDFDCHLNGRPDDDFVKWRWQPNECDIPSLNATDFLERLRGKRLVFMGDSLNRNMWESLVCILRHSVTDKNKVYEITGRKEFKKQGFYAFRYEDYNCSIDLVTSPFLVKESFNGANQSVETLRLDVMDHKAKTCRDADVVVFNTGHWWTHEKTSKGENYYQEGNFVYPKLKVLHAFQKALTTWARWVDKNINANRTQVFFRGYSLTHFSGGKWNSGGHCHRETEPIYNETYLEKYPSKMKILEHVLQQMSTPVVYMNISKLTDYRKDAHPSIYRKRYETVEEQIAAEKAQDCSHWCLPGVPDTWNELLYASLLRSGRGPWRT